MSFEAFAKFLNGESTLDQLKDDLGRTVQANAARMWEAQTRWDNSFLPTSNENYHRVIDTQLYDRATGRDQPLPTRTNLLDAFQAHLSGNRDVLDYQRRVNELGRVAEEYRMNNTYNPVDDRLRHDIATGQDPRYNDPYGSTSNTYSNTYGNTYNDTNNSYDDYRSYSNYNTYNDLW